MTERRKYSLFRGLKPWRAGKWPLLIVLAAILPFITGLTPVIRFPREKVLIHVYPDAIEVIGRYDYENPWPFPVVQGLVYPLPENGDHSLIQAPRVFIAGQDSSPLPCHRVLGVHRFDLYLASRERIRVFVTYRQTVHDRKGVYILKTTQSWGRPLDTADYYLVPHGVRITGSNIPLRRRESGRWHGRRFDFMPREDWTFTWRNQ